MAIVLHEQQETDCPSATVERGDLWLSNTDLERATGWTLKPEGICQGDVCVPLPPGRAVEFVHGERINLSAFWRHLGSPTASDATGTLYVLGRNAQDRASALESLEAPDFTLPDLGGHTTALSSLRGKKVLLATWASW